MVDVTHQTDDSIRLTLRLSASAYEGIVELSMASRRRFNPQLSYQLDIAMRSGAEFIKLLPSYRGSGDFPAIDCNSLCRPCHS